MKTRSLLHTLLLSLLMLCAVSCSSDDDDEYDDPIGTISINLLNEDNGKTELGNSDVYIDNAYNFYGPTCLIAQLGKRNGLGNISAPVLAGLGVKVAVEPGYAYQIFRNAAIKEFPSKKLALNISGDYYNVYVVSQLLQGEAVVGANVKFVLADAPDKDLPEYNTHLGTIDHLNYLEDRFVEIELPTSDFEYEPVNGYNQMEYEKEGKTLRITLISYVESDIFGAYIRIGESYTYVYGMVQ